ncbi:pseudouridine synthase, RluA family [Syntrophobotulus glycolicus DSM 8271]|uniref:Pseudouridine synthase n=1 Tax=Syntrophobotulus glycolicus (strain DSM 8271 / FlGlyR) TaxID=645991 RepID=F0SYN8_SYNGF|nr:RluA family pseudouridine synthase [Syntrophobotulus glycolicus]ADY54839.1 pseudouridine synthase, RluA family [Syntrophobotulus glycolicus DSM 8271]
MKSYLKYTIAEEHQGLTVEEYLKKALQISGRKIQKLTRLTGILLNGKKVFLQKKLRAGDLLSVLSLQDRSYGVNPEAGAIDILYEDESLIVLNKPAGLLVHPAGMTTSGTLANYLADYFRQLGVICTIRPLHRLDRDTSGCLVFAKGPVVQSKMEDLLAAGKIKRTYLALAEGLIIPAEGTISAPIASDPAKPNRRMVSEKGSQAITHYRKLKTFGQNSLVELNLETGRTHQIRVHLAYLGHPILGDRMYGRKSPLISRQALHAVKISFQHPVKETEICLEAKLPGDFLKCLEMS